MYKDKDGNVPDNMNNDANDVENQNELEIAGVDDHNILEITGIDESNEQNFEYTTQQTEETIVQENEYTEFTTQHNHRELNYDNTNKQYNRDFNDNVSIEDRSTEDTYVSINYMNTVLKMNAGQLNLDPKTGEEDMGNVTMPTHTYNLRPRPTRRNEKYNMTQVRQQSTIVKLHMHMMKTQMSINEGIKRFR